MTYDQLNREHLLEWLVERAQPITNGRDVSWKLLPKDYKAKMLHFNSPGCPLVSSREVIELFCKEHPYYPPRDKEEELANVDMGIKIFLPVAVIVALLSAIGFYHVVCWIL